MSIIDVNHISHMLGFDLYTWYVYQMIIIYLINMYK